MMKHSGIASTQQSGGTGRKSYLTLRSLEIVLVSIFVILIFHLTVWQHPNMSKGMSMPAHAGTEDSVLRNTHFVFSAPTGYFLPSLLTTNPVTFDATRTNFGLISQPYDSDRSLNIEAPTDWQRFSHHLSELNEKAPDHIQYKLLYLSRHGQGYHNLAEAYYGTPAWNCYYSALAGDPLSDIGWTDARLSKLGELQARNQSLFWRHQLSTEKIPAPEAWYVSPLERACRTAEITFDPLKKDGLLDFEPVNVKELLREGNGIHTCDMRSSRSSIAARFPNFLIEAGFSERDQLWGPTYRETDGHLIARVLELLDDILSSQKGKASTITSMVAHNGVINALLKAVGHREFLINVGQAIAVVVKLEEVSDPRPTYHGSQGDTIPQCVDDPLKAGLPGYNTFREYVNTIEADIS